MPLPKNTRFRFRELPKKEGKERRQRLAFNPKTNLVIEAQTQIKNRSGWIPVHGSSKARGTVRQL